MDSSNDPDSQQTANASLFDEDNFDFFAELAGRDHNKADTSDGRNSDALDDLFDFCSIQTTPIQPVPPKDENTTAHPDLLIDIGECDFSILSPEPVTTDNSATYNVRTDSIFTDSLLGADTSHEVPTEEPKKTYSMEQEIESSWTLVDTGSNNDSLFEDMLFGDGGQQRTSSSSQQVPDVIIDDLFGSPPDLIHDHNQNMDEANHDGGLECFQHDDENINNNGLPTNNKRHSTQSSDTNKESSRSSADFDEDLDFSVIQDTNCLDIDLVKQKTSLRKRGSLALRKKPTRSSMKRVVSQSEETRFKDSTEPKLTVANGVEDDDDDDEVFKKSRTKSPAVNKPKPPRGAFAPSLSQINKSKVLTKKTSSSSIKSETSSIKKETSSISEAKHTNFRKSTNNNALVKEDEIPVKLKPVVTASSDIAAAESSSTKPKLVFASHNSGKPDSTSTSGASEPSKPNLVHTPKSGTKPKVAPRSLIKSVSKEQKETRNQLSAVRSISTDLSLDREFTELAKQIEHSEGATPDKKPVEPSQNDDPEFENSFGSRQQSRSSTSSNTDSTTPIKQTSTPSIKQTSSTPVKQSSTPSIKQTSTTTIKQTSTTPIKQMSTPSIKQTSTKPVKQSSTERNHNDDKQLENILSPIASKQKGKSSRNSDTSVVKRDTPTTSVKKHAALENKLNEKKQFKSLDREFDELATRIEQSEVKKPTPLERKHNERTQSESTVSSIGSKQKNKIPLNSTSSDTSDLKSETSTAPNKKSSSVSSSSFDSASLHTISADQTEPPLRKVSFDESPLSKVSFDESPLCKVSFDESPLRKVSFDESPLSKVSFDESPLCKVSFDESSSKEKAEVVKPLQKVSLIENKLPDDKTENSPIQPPWATKKLKSTEDTSKKMMQEQKPEKPTWFKAAQEKKARAAEIVIAQENRNQENNTRIEEPEDKKSSPWLGERQLRKTVKPKPLTENNDNTSQPSHHTSNNNEENLLQTSNNVDRLSPLKSVRKDSSTSPITPNKDDYAPSWMQGNKLKSVSTPNLNHIKVSPSDQITSPVSPGSSSEMPQWKKELVNRKKTKDSDVQSGSNKEDTSQDQSPGVMWKLQQTKKRKPVSPKVEVETNVPKEPEWKRAAEEKRKRFLKSGMIEQQ